MNDARITPNRFQNNPAFKRGFEAGGPLLGQAALVLGGYGFTVHEDSFDPKNEVETAEEQESVLEENARERGFWYPDPLQHYKNLGYSFYGFGGEAQVFAEKDEYVHKVCRIAQYESLVRFFDRLMKCLKIKLIVICVFWVFGRILESRTESFDTILTRLSLRTCIKEIFGKPPIIMLSSLTEHLDSIPPILGRTVRLSPEECDLRYWGLGWFVRSKLLWFNELSFYYILISRGIVFW